MRQKPHADGQARCKRFSNTSRCSLAVFANDETLSSKQSSGKVRVTKSDRSAAVETWLRRSSIRRRDPKEKPLQTPRRTSSRYETNCSWFHSIPGDRENETGR